MAQYVSQQLEVEQYSGSCGTDMKYKHLHIDPAISDPLIEGLLDTVPVISLGSTVPSIPSQRVETLGATA